MQVAAVGEAKVRGRGGRPRKTPPKYVDMASSLAAALRSAVDTSTLRWPSSKYRENPVAFCRDILGIEPWSKQVEVLEALRDHKRVAVCSGHKCGKSETLAMAALWFFCSFEDARVVATCVTARQVDGIVYRAIRKLHARAGHCVACRKESARRVEERRPPLPVPCEHSARIDGEPATLARTGIRTDDFREIAGFTAAEPEAVAGVSGKNILYLPDEASGIPREIFEAIEGNRAGGNARVLMASNPTKTDGVFFDAFEDPKVSELWHQVHVSSEETPNVVQGRDVIPGLASLEWVEEKRAEWGEDSPLYRVRVKGQFVRNETAKIISLHLLGEAEARWESTPADGPLRVGVDPAGPGEGGDESAFAARRGKKQIALKVHRGLDEHRLVDELLVFVRDLRRPRETPTVIVDGEGPTGQKVVRVLREHLDRNEGDFVLVVVFASNHALNRREYDRVREELWANGRDWLRDGGAIMSDPKQTKELHAPEWIQQTNAPLKVTPKSELRKLLQRSPDRADAFLLSLWEPMALRPDNDAPAPQRANAMDPYEDNDVITEKLSPYGGAF